MPLWGNTDVAAQSAIYAPQQLKVAPNTTNRDALFGNTTADAFIENVTVGQYGVDATEIEATRFDKEARPAHTGWVLRTEGTGGRAGRIQHEVLVALSVSGDAENTAFQQTAVNVTTNPSDTSANAVNNDIATFTVDSEVYPASNAGSQTYKWQIWDGSAFTNVADGAVYSNTAEATVYVDANGVNEGSIFRCGVYLTGADTEYSANALLDLYPDVTISDHPADASGNSTADDIVTFSVNAAAEGETINYQWQMANSSNTDEFLDLSDAGAYSNTTTDELSVLANTASDGEIYRVELTVADTAIVTYSNSATITITS